MPNDNKPTKNYNFLVSHYYTHLCNLGDFFKWQLCPKILKITGAKTIIFKVKK